MANHNLFFQTKNVYILYVYKKEEKKLNNETWFWNIEQRWLLCALCLYYSFIRFFFPTFHIHFIDSGGLSMNFCFTFFPMWLSKPLKCVVFGFLQILFFNVSGLQAKTVLDRLSSSSVGFIRVKWLRAIGLNQLYSAERITKIVVQRRYAYFGLLAVSFCVPTIKYNIKYRNVALR